ncbi:hypothetical protein T06_3267 [Trichinella sp. T6]|nr:hypothetical protein T06_3267 [Trichinella sp. T6]
MPRRCGRIWQIQADAYGKTEERAERILPVPRRDLNHNGWMSLASREFACENKASHSAPAW